MGFFSYDITVTQESRFLRITVAGRASADRNERGLKRIAKEAKRRSASKVLLDLRAVVGEWESEDRYDAGVFFASDAFSYVRVAVHAPATISFQAGYSPADLLNPAEVRASVQ